MRLTAAAWKKLSLRRSDDRDSTSFAAYDCIAAGTQDERGVRTRRAELGNLFGHDDTCSFQVAVVASDLVESIHRRIVRRVMRQGTPAEPHFRIRVEPLESAKNGTDDDPVAMILRSLPEWFGIEEATQMSIDDARRSPTWVAYQISEEDESGESVGFVTLRTHFERASAEIHCMGVMPDVHRSGVGRRLIAFAEDHLRDEGVRFLQVKTLGTSKPCEHYDRTRAFYLAQGFTPLEEFADLWPGNPALMLVKVL